MDYFLDEQIIPGFFLTFFLHYLNFAPVFIN